MKANRFWPTRVTVPSSCSGSTAIARFLKLTRPYCAGRPLGEAPLDGAKRELAEETGLVAAEWREVMRAQLSNSITDERMIGYLALGLSEGPQRPEPDPTEAITLIRVPFREALEAAIAGHLQDMLTVAMLLRGYHMASERALPGALARAMLG